MPTNSYLNEAQTRYNLIDPLIEKAGWNLSDRHSVDFEIPVNRYDAIQVGKDHFRSQKRGVRQKNLKLTMTRDINLPLPLLTLQQQFADILTQT